MKWILEFGISWKYGKNYWQFLMRIRQTHCCDLRYIQEITTKIYSQDFSVEISSWKLYWKRLRRFPKWSISTSSILFLDSQIREKFDKRHPKHENFPKRLIWQPIESPIPFVITLAGQSLEICWWFQTNLHRLHSKSD